MAHLRKFLMILLMSIALLGLSHLLWNHSPAEARSLTMTVNCLPPKPGTYWLGWGTSRLVIPEHGQAYTTFRGKTTPMTDTLCLAADNVSVVAFRPNENSVWAYVVTQE